MRYDVDAVGWLLNVPTCQCISGTDLSQTNVLAAKLRYKLYMTQTSCTDNTLNSPTYLCLLLPVEHRPSTTPRHRTPFWAALVIPDQLIPCCFISASVFRLQQLRDRPLFLCPCVFLVRAWRVVLDAGFLRGVSDPTALPPQYLLSHWFLSRSLPQIFISDLLLPLDLIDEPQTGVEECLDISCLSLRHRVLTTR